MKTVILFGSPHKDGNTRQLVDVFTGVMKGKQKEVRVLYLNDMNIRPCQACQSCSEGGICRIHDDMKDICKYIMESDVVVYATPIYWSGPSAQMKLAMDRCLAFLDPQLNSRVKGKKAVTLMCCADEDNEMCRPSLDMFDKTFEGLGMIYAGNVEATGCTDKGRVKEEILEATRRVAESVL